MRTELAVDNNPGELFLTGLQVQFKKINDSTQSVKKGYSYKQAVNYKRPVPGEPAFIQQYSFYSQHEEFNQSHSGPK